MESNSEHSDIICSLSKRKEPMIQTGQDLILIYYDNYPISIAEFVSALDLLYDQNVNYEKIIGLVQIIRSIKWTLIMVYYIK